MRPVHHRGLDVLGSPVRPDGQEVPARQGGQEDGAGGH